ncbi:MAG: hypothetical protein mread185_000446 [Mycoplasmataceae bacterium]|nr:MAG: hypothetical protein mread185_000446 [Mycoplasmataceae bacterium]
MASPLKWASKKLEEDAGKAILRGDLSGAIGTLRIYCVVLIFAWLVVLIISWVIINLLASWIIEKFWHEPLLSSQRIDF